MSAYASVFLSVILSRFTLGELYVELRRRDLTWQTGLAAALAIAPLVFFLFVDFLPFHHRS